MEIRHILKKERKKRAMTQDELAEYLNISQSAYNKYESGKNMPTTESIIKLARLYKCSTDYLLGIVKYNDEEYEK